MGYDDIDRNMGRISTSPSIIRLMAGITDRYGDLIKG